MLYYFYSNTSLYSEKCVYIPSNEVEKLNQLIQIWNKQIKSKGTSIFQLLQKKYKVKIICYDNVNT